MNSTILLTDRPVGLPLVTERCKRLFKAVLISGVIETPCPETPFISPARSGNPFRRVKGNLRFPLNCTYHGCPRQTPGREQQLSGSSAASRDNTGIDANRGSIQRLGELRGWQVVTDLHEQRRQPVVEPEAPDAVMMIGQVESGPK